MFLGTASDNTQDAVRKGRWRKPDPHPSVAYYKHHGCRCVDCKALYAEFTKAVRERNKDKIKEQKKISYQKTDKAKRLANRLANPEKYKEQNKRYRENRKAKKLALLE